MCSGATERIKTVFLLPIRTEGHRRSMNLNRIWLQCTPQKTVAWWATFCAKRGKRSSMSLTSCSLTTSCGLDGFTADVSVATEETFQRVPGGKNVQLLTVE